DDGELYRYVAASDSWAPPSAGPSMRYGAFGAWDSNFFVVWGGRHGNGARSTFADGKRFDLMAGAWLDLATSGAPTARWAPQRETGWSARVSGGRVLFLGGRPAVG